MNPTAPLILMALKIESQGLFERAGVTPFEDTPPRRRRGFWRCIGS